MKVTIAAYDIENKSFIRYKVQGLKTKELIFFKDNIEDSIEIVDNDLFITVYFDKGLHPFESNESQYNLDAIKITEIIEMTYFLNSLLEDFYL